VLFWFEHSWYDKIYFYFENKPMKEKFKLKDIWHLVKEASIGFSDDKVIKLSGSLAYFTIFSIGPMLIVIMFFADLFWGREAIEGTIYGQINGFVGSNAAAQIQEIIKNVTLSGSTVTVVIGFITLLIGATTVFAEIQDSINTIWNLKVKPEKGWVKMILDRLLSFSVVVGLAFLLLVSLIMNGLLEALGNKLVTMFPQIAVIIIYIFNLVLTLAVITFLFAVIFKVLPDAKIKWRDVLVGSIVTALLFMLGKFALTFYIGKSDIGTTYGTAGALVVLLLWVYFSSIILYFGAEFTKVFAAKYGSRIHPSQYAVWIKHIEVEEGKGTLKHLEEKKKEENDNTDDKIKVT
jgi:membrane protein